MTTSAKIMSTLLSNRISEIQDNWKTPWIKGNEIEAFWQGNADALRAAIDAAINEDKWLCPVIEHNDEDSYYTISKDAIYVPNREQYANDDYFCADVLHNMAHSTGSEKNLNRLRSSSFGCAAYTKEDLTVELTAAYVSARYGIEKPIKEDSLTYLRSWLDRIDEDETFVDDVLQDVLDASKIIINYIESFN